jgi:hypothetical protein
MSPEAQTTIKVVAGTVLVVSLVLGFFERWYKPDTYVTSQSKEIPAWIGWLGWGLAACATAAYVFVDFVQLRA